MTGIGEGAIRLVLAKTACDFMSNGLGAQRAVRKSVKLLWARLRMKIGMIAVDARGRVGVAHSTRDLCWAVAVSGMRGPRAAIK